MLTKLNQSELAKGLIAGVILIAIWVVMGAFWPVGSDYFYTFRPAAEAFLKGETRLYSDPGFGFYGAPWALLVIFPTLLMPLSYGQAVLTMLVLVGLVFSVMAVPEEKERLSPLVVVVTFANLHTFDAIVRGNLDGLPLIGLGLSWLGVRLRRPLWLGIGLWFIACKPINLVLVVLYMLWHIRHWRPSEKLQVVIPLAVTVLVTSCLIGWDWPVRYINYSQQRPPQVGLQTSLWRTFILAGLPRWSATLVGGIGMILALWMLLKKKLGRNELALALCASLTFSPYTLGSHYTLLAMAFAILVQSNRAVMWAWLLTFTPLVRIWLGHSASWIDILYPLALLILAYRNLHSKELILEDCECAR